MDINSWVMHHCPCVMAKSQLASLLTKHVNMNKNIHDKIAHQQLTPITHNGKKKHHKCTEEHSDKNIGSGS